MSTCPESASWAIAGTTPPALSKSSMSVVHRGGPPEFVTDIRPVQKDQGPDAERVEEDAIAAGDRQASDDEGGRQGEPVPAEVHHARATGDHQTEPAPAH